MHQFVRKKPASCARLWGVLSCSEDDVAAHGVGAGMERVCGNVRLRIGMDTNAAEVEAKAPFEEVSRDGVKRLTWRSDRVIADFWQSCFSVTCLSLCDSAGSRFTCGLHP
jgi:hypothetical protein